METKEKKAWPPAPWFYQPGGKNYFPAVVLGGDDPKSRDGICINSLYGRNGGAMRECRATARLIVAAPEMFALLEQVAASMPVNDGGVRSMNGTTLMRLAPVIEGLLAKIKG